jgi:hypothetical protein
MEVGEFSEPLVLILREVAWLVESGSRFLLPGEFKEGPATTGLCLLNSIFLSAVGEI